ncbi:MAG: hypothetical protein OEY94_10990 [Alphaproteobacteria bacterium]|nr:hypothetical protein [Alphaproteobacteria bacterium]
MSSVKFALEKLNDAVEKLDVSLVTGKSFESQNSGVGTDFIVQRLDSAIRKVEMILSE